jgi:hypothetical protein
MNLDEAIGEAAQAMRDDNTVEAWEGVLPGHVPIAVYAKAAIEAAAPILERQVREKIAHEIHDNARDKRGVAGWVDAYHNGLEEAIRIARGSSPSSSTEEKGQQ